MWEIISRNVKLCSLLFWLCTNFFCFLYSQSLTETNLVEYRHYYCSLYFVLDSLHHSSVCLYCIICNIWYVWFLPSIWDQINKLTQNIVHGYSLKRKKKRGKSGHFHRIQRWSWSPSTIQTILTVEVLSNNHQLGF